VVECLSLSNVKVVSTPPVRKNLTLSMNQIEIMIESVMNMSTKIRKQRIRYTKTIILCQNYNYCTQVYGMLEHLMGHDVAEPPSYPNLHPPNFY